MQCLINKKVTNNMNSLFRLQLYGITYFNNFQVFLHEWEDSSGIHEAECVCLHSAAQQPVAQRALWFIHSPCNWDVPFICFYHSWASFICSHIYIIVEVTVLWSISQLYSYEVWTQRWSCHHCSHMSYTSITDINCVYTYV